ncbi:hypothetical protein RJ639_019525 [Escallonia herrerae]|uniref:Protein kinase domain-containing protein n=1 Tax=Escallonia herrerae TaxID=1293975 RepID=A0AA88VA43_9ASTE|nr:hypothetical protein RJ639_019525 [Escallonia herrerae]
MLVYYRKESAIDELEKLRQPLSAAVADETQLALERHTLTQNPPTPETLEKQADDDAKLTVPLYYVSAHICLTNLDAKDIVRDLPLSCHLLGRGKIIASLTDFAYNTENERAFDSKILAAAVLFDTIDSIIPLGDTGNVRSGGHREEQIDSLIPLGDASVPSASTFMHDRARAKVKRKMFHGISLLIRGKRNIGRRKDSPGPDHGQSSWGRLWGSIWQGPSSRGRNHGPSSTIVSLPPHPLPELYSRQFSLTEIRAATNDFDEDHIVTYSQYSEVYRGQIHNGQDVIINRFRNWTYNFPRDSMASLIVQLSSLCHHPNLVFLIGHYYDEYEVIFVYEHMENGTLRDHLYGTSNDPLSWEQRLHICIDAAQGLNHLHSLEAPNFVHIDINSTAILLNDSSVAKITPLWSSILGLVDPDLHVSTFVTSESSGDISRYSYPEYQPLRRESEKSGLYAFGVLLLEVLCARKPIEMHVSEDLSHWVQTNIGEKTLDHVDPYMRGTIAPDCLSKYIEIALSCLHDWQQMGQVVAGLKSALEVQKNAEVSSDRTGPGFNFEEMILRKTSPTENWDASSNASFDSDSMKFGR